MIEFKKLLNNINKIEWLEYLGIILGTFVKFHNTCFESMVKISISLLKRK